MNCTVSIVEDNKTFQEALAQLIRESAEFTLLNVYSSAEAALEMVKRPPDLAIIDIQLPGINGIELMRRLRAGGVQTQFLVCSMHDDDDTIMKALEGGASGYILKESSIAQIRSGLQEVLRGGAPMSPFIARRVISFFHKPRLTEEAALLSRRERDILQHLSEGLSAKEIGARLFISPETVKKHLQNIYHKLHVQNRVEAINKFKMM